MSNTLEVGKGRQTNYEFLQLYYETKFTVLEEKESKCSFVSLVDCGVN